MKGVYQFLDKLTRSSLFIAALILLMATIVFSRYGYQSKLRRDDAIYAYSGQQMSRGIPPYVSIFDHKGPMAHLIAGGASSLANVLDFDDLITIRITFFLISSLAVVAVYFLAYSLFSSRLLGLLSALVFLGFRGFSRHALSGPRAKSPMVLFEVLSLFLTARRQWFLAGICGSLAFLTWQPMAVYPLVTMFLAVAQAESLSERIKNLLWTASGVLLPIAAVLAYFTYMGALKELLEGTIVFNIYYLERAPSSFFKHITAPIRGVFKGYASMAVPIFVGLLMVCLMFIWRTKSQGGSFRRFLAKDPFAALLITFPAPVIWSLIDFQRYPDFFVFLPYAALGFGWLLFLALESIKGLGLVGPVAQKVFTVLLCVALIGSAAAFSHLDSGHGLVKQKEWATQVEALLGNNSKIVSIGVPQILVLLRRTNPTRYVFLSDGVDNLINAKTSGGFDGWLEELDRHEPSFIVLGGYKGKFKDKLMDWLRTNYQEQQIGRWKLFARNGEKASSSYPSGSPLELSRPETGQYE